MNSKRKATPSERVCSSSTCSHCAFTSAMRGLELCELCPPEFQDLFYLDERDLILHKAVKHDEVRPISCNLCATKLGDAQEFELHMKNFHERCPTHVRCYRGRCFKIVSTEHLSEHYKTFHPLLEQLDFQSNNIGETIALFGLIENNFVATRYHCFDCSRDFICSSLIECNLCANERNPNVYAAFVKTLDFIIHLQKDHGLKFDGMLTCPFKDSGCNFLGEVLQVSEHVERSHSSCRMHICCSPQCSVLLNVSNYANAHFKPEECQYLEGSNEAFTTYLRHVNSKPLKVGHIKAADLKGQQNSKSKSVLYFQKNPAETGKIFYASVLKCPVPKVDYETKFFAYKCITCAFVFQLPQDSKLIHHSCPFCHLVFFSLIEAKAHVSSCHRYCETSAKHKCTECELIADSSEKVIRHRVACHSLCREHLLCVSNKGCKNVFKTFRQLSRHLSANECKGQIEASEKEKETGSLIAVDNVYKCTSCCFSEVLDARNFVECSQCNDHSPVFLVSEVDLSVHNYLRDQLDVDEMILLQCFKKDCPPKWLRLLEYFVHRDQTHNFCSLHFVCHFKDCRTLMPSLQSLLLHQVTCQKNDRGRRGEDLESKNANSQLQKMICSYSQSLKSIRLEKYACRFCNEVFESTMLFFCKLCPFDVSPVLFIDGTEFLFHLSLFHKTKCEIELECNLPLRDNVPCKVSGKVQEILKHRIMNHNICAVHIKCPFKDCNFLFDNVDDVLSHRTGSGHLEMIKPVFKFTRQESSKNWTKSGSIESFAVVPENLQKVDSYAPVRNSQIDRDGRFEILEKPVIEISGMKSSEIRTCEPVLSSHLAAKVRQVSSSLTVGPSRSPIKRQSFGSSDQDGLKNGSLGSHENVMPRPLSSKELLISTAENVLHNPEVATSKSLPKFTTSELLIRDTKPLGSDCAQKESAHVLKDSHEDLSLPSDISKPLISVIAPKESPSSWQDSFPRGREESLDAWKKNIEVPVSRARAPFPRLDDRNSGLRDTSTFQVSLKPQELVSTSLPLPEVETRHSPGSPKFGLKATDFQSRKPVNGPILIEKGDVDESQSAIEDEESTKHGSSFSKTQECIQRDRPVFPRNDEHGVRLNTVGFIPRTSAGLPPLRPVGFRSNNELAKPVGFQRNNKLLGDGLRPHSSVVGFVPPPGKNRSDNANLNEKMSTSAIPPPCLNVGSIDTALAPSKSTPVSLSLGKLSVDFLDEPDSNEVTNASTGKVDVTNKECSISLPPNETFDFIESIRDFVSNETDIEASESRLLQEGSFELGPFVTNHEKSIYFGHLIALPVVTKSLIQAPSRIKFYVCSRCGFKKDLALDDFVNHYICSICDIAFMCEFEATYHYCYSHNKEFPLMRENVSCDFCRHPAENLDEWISHRRSHHNFCTEHIVCMSSGCLSRNIFASREELFDHISRIGCIKKGRIQRIDRANSPYFAELLNTNDFLCQLTCIACSFSQYKQFDGMKAVTYAKCCTDEPFATSEDRNQHLASLHHNSSGMLIQKIIQTCLNCKVQLPVLASMLHNVYNHVQCSQHYVCPNDSCMLLFPSPSLVAMHHKNCIMTFFTFKQKEILARIAVGPPKLPEVAGQWKKKAPKIDNQSFPLNSGEFRERNSLQNQEKSPFRIRERPPPWPRQRSPPGPRQRSPPGPRQRSPPGFRERSREKAPLTPRERSPPRSEWNDLESNPKPEEDLQLDGFLAQLRNQSSSSTGDRSRDDSGRNRKESETSNRSERKRHRRSRSRDRKQSEESTASSIDDFLKQARYGET